LAQHLRLLVSLLLDITSMGGDWTNAGRTVADAGILTTVDINGGTIDSTKIGKTTPAEGWLSPSVAKGPAIITSFAGQ